MDFINNGTGRPRPKAGYRCKICGKEGGLPDSHWYQLCPFKGKASDKRTFNPPRKGYICKFCHKQGGEPDSHWFQQCPKRHEFEGIQVPHPLKLRAAAANAGMLHMLPQTLSAQAAMALNVGVMANPGQLDYHQQFAANGMGIYMYPQHQAQQPMMNNQMAQQYFLQPQQLQTNISAQGSQGLASWQGNQTSQLETQAQVPAETNRGLYSHIKIQRFRQEQGLESDDALLNQITKKTQEMTFTDSSKQLPETNQTTEEEKTLN